MDHELFLPGQCPCAPPPPLYVNDLPYATKSFQGKLFSDETKEAYIKKRKEKKKNSSLNSFEQDSPLGKLWNAIPGPAWVH